MLYFETWFLTGIIPQGNEVSVDINVRKIIRQISTKIKGMILSIMYHIVININFIN